MRGSGGEDGRTFVQSGVVDLDRELFGLVQAPGGQLPADEVITRDGKSYRRAELFPRSLDIKTPWATLDYKAMGEALGIEGPVAEPGDKESDFDPATMLEQLRKEADRVEAGGTEVVRGVSTTRYSVTLKPNPKPTAKPDEPPQPEQGPMTIWVGDDGLVRRLESRMAVSAFSGSPAQELRYTGEFFDFGVPVDLKVPGPSETTDITARWVDMMKAHGSGTTESSSVRSWSTVTTGKVGSTRWTFQQGKAANSAVCTRLRLDPPVQIPGWSAGPPVPNMPPGLGSSPPTFSEVPPPPLPPDVLAALPSGGSPSPPSTLVAPDGSIVPFPPVMPPSAPETTDTSTVAGIGTGCGDFMTSVHGFTADAGGLGWIFGVVPPGAQQATVRLAGAAGTAVPFHDGLFVLVHPATQRLEELVFTRHGQPLQVCKPPPDQTMIGVAVC
jgi:hypothetical protein